MARAVLVWAAMALAMVGAGALRVGLVEPRAPAWVTELFGAVLGVVLILALTRRFVRSIPSPDASLLAGLALLWVGLTIAFEFALGRWAGRSWASQVENYDLTRGHLWPVVLLAVGAVPFVWGWRRT